MTDWLQHLAQYRAQSNAHSLEKSVASTDFFASLDHLGHITFSGDDAATFLHNQLTNDVEHLGVDEARLAGYCSPKGRLLASLLIWRASDAITLQLPRELQQAVQKRLQMYVMRAKVKVTDSNNNTVAFGLVKEDASWQMDLACVYINLVDRRAKVEMLENIV